MALNQIDRLAILKLLLHASKYPAASVNGLLLGTAGQDHGVCIVDAIPLFHTNSLNLAPYMEIALTQLDIYAKKKKLQVVGYYYGDACYKNNELHAAGKKVADRIHEHFPEVVVLLIDNPKLAAFTESGKHCPCEVLMKEVATKTWKKVKENGLELTTGQWGDVRDEFLMHVQDNSNVKIADYDEHLDDVSRDYLNPWLL